MEDFLSSPTFQMLIYTLLGGGTLATGAVGKVGFDRVRSGKGLLGAAKKPTKAITITVSLDPDDVLSFVASIHAIILGFQESPESINRAPAPNVSNVQ